MKYRIILLVLATFLSFGNESNAQGKRAARATVWELLERNNPDARYFMTSLYNLPTEINLGNMQITLSEPTDFMEYIDDYDTEGILDEIGTAVHESCHAYESMKVFHYITAGEIPYEFEDSYSVYYISSDEEYVVKQTETFPSREFADEIPEKYRTLRYKTYIDSPVHNLGTQQKGIYGLMDEWTAYYNGFKTTVMNYPEYEKLAKRNASKYLKYIEHAASHKVAYLEFKYYILHYLYFARNNHRDEYNEIIHNQQFIKSYKAVDLAYTEMIRVYEKRIMLIKKDVESRGDYFSYDGETVWIGNNGIGTFSEDEDALKQAIEGVKYLKIVESLEF
jgi:hypothetical protein